MENVIEREDISLSKYRVALNVSGEIFETWESTLRRYPDTLLGDPQRRQDHYTLDTDQFFFDRNRAAFEAILFFYQSSGRLTRPCNVRFETFEAECDYFQLPKWAVDEMKVKEGMYIEDEDEEERKRQADKNCRQMIWDFVDKPESSRPAKYLAIFSISMILFSVILACIESLPSIQRWIKKNKLDPTQHYLEYALNGWFLFELLIRLAASPKKLPFLIAPMNIVDIIAVVPYFIMTSIPGDHTYHRALRVLRFIRIVRLLRLGRQSKRMKLVGKILMSTVEDVKELLLCLLIVVIFGGSIEYYAEMNEKGTSFTSIPQSLWWGIQTVVVLGYGDIVPTSFFGKVFASTFMVFGALTIALPVLSVVTKFSSIYATNAFSR